MDRIIAKTIVDATKKNQEMLIKKFESFLETWERATSDFEFEGQDEITIAEELKDDGFRGKDRIRYFLRLGSREIDYYYNGIISDEYPKHTMKLIKKVFKEDVTKKIKDYFENLQKGIDKNREIEDRINDLINRLS